MIGNHAGHGRLSSSQAAEIQGLVNFATSFFLSRAYRHLNLAVTSIAEQQANTDGELLKNVGATVHRTSFLWPRLALIMLLENTATSCCSQMGLGRTIRQGATLYWLTRRITIDLLVQCL